MKPFRKKVYACAGYNTLYMGPGRKEFNPEKLREFEEYLKETAQGTLAQIKNPAIDEGIIGSFMSARFLKQSNLAGFLPMMVPALTKKPCTAVEGACGTGGRAIAMAMRSVLSDLSEVVFVSGFEMQNSVKSVYGADILAGAGYYNKERKEGHAFFFPSIFDQRAKSYFDTYGEDKTRQAMAKWFEQAITQARTNPKAQEFQNAHVDLKTLAMTKPNPEQFLTCLNLYNCSKITDGASSLLITSEKGLENLGLTPKDAIEIIGLGEAERDITQTPEDLNYLATTAEAAKKALEQAGITPKDLSMLEIHDCFAITALMMLEAIGVVEKGKASDWILENQTTPTGALPTNLSGGLMGFGHPTGASGVRMLVDLIENLKGKPNKKGMLVSMGGNDVTVTSLVAQSQ